MRPFDELTRLGRLRRLHGLAHAALRRFGLSDAPFALARYAGNTLYRVHSGKRAHRSDAGGLFVPGQLLLRVHWPGYRDAAAIRLELEWLRSLRETSGLPVPEPVPARGGDLLVEVSHPGIPEPRYCSLLRWVRGRRLGEKAKVRHYAAQGRLMAGMHAHAQAWRLPRGSTPRVYDGDGLFRVVPALCLPVDDVWPLLPKAYLGAFEEVARRVRQAMADLGDGPDAFGLIHADLGVDANLLFWRDRPRAIDFDESGLGYWIYDLAVTLEHCREQRDYQLYRDALLGGYREIRTLPEEQLRHLDLFMAALDVHIGLWAGAVVGLNPGQKALRRRLDRCARLVERYLETGTQEKRPPRGAPRRS